MNLEYCDKSNVMNRVSTMSSALENEDLDNVPLVNMEDVQPSRDRIDRTLGMRSLHSNDEMFEICVIEKTAYEDCTIGDDSDSNIGSMVSIKSEMAGEDAEDSDSAELIVPEVLDPPRVINVPITFEKIEIDQPQPKTWPTLEILPGGVIKNAVDWESDSTHCSSKKRKIRLSHEEMSYACAKCSQTFKQLFSLVKHVKLHKPQKKTKSDPLMVLKYHPSAVISETSGATECSCQHTDKPKVTLSEPKLKSRTGSRKPKRLKS